MIIITDKYYFKEIKNTPFYDIQIKNKSLIIKLKKENNLIISSWHNGGYQQNMDYILNQTVENKDYDDAKTNTINEFQKQAFKKLNLPVDKTAGLITSACMDNVSIKTEKYEDLEVTAIITAGADKNGIKAGDPASFYEYNHNYKPLGTINIIIIINANLDPGTLVNAIITTTEAKTSVLEDLKLESQYSTHIATGTGTDGICVISNKSSNNHLENAGKHSKLGELIALTTRKATYEALYMQTAMSNEYQKDVISRLTRFNIDYETLINKATIPEDEYIPKFYEFINNPQNIAWISMMINLIDEYQNNLLKISEITPLIIQTTQNYLEITYEDNLKTVDDILNYIINSINKKIES